MLEESVESDSPELEREVLALGALAYGEDLTELYREIGPATHVLVRDGGLLVSHAMWVTRWLQVGAARPLKTAYVEFVATHPEFRNRGLASQVMRRLVSEIPDSYELAALCPATAGLYQRLGWRFWRGPLFARTAGRRIPTPDERVMILPLAKTPRLDLDLPLSVEWRPGEVW